MENFFTKEPTVTGDELMETEITTPTRELGQSTINATTLIKPAVKAKPAMIKRRVAKPVETPSVAPAAETTSVAPEILTPVATPKAEAEIEDSSAPAWKRYTNQWSFTKLENLIKSNEYTDSYGDIDYSLEGIDTTKLNRTAKDFGVDPDAYPIFNAQTVQTSATEKERWNIDKTLSTYLTFTADTIAVLDGSTEKPKADVVLYLDKSARPVSWLVDEFWDDFAQRDAETEQPAQKPENIYLNIDRLVWFRRVGLEVDDNMYLKNENRKATPSDFKAAAFNEDGTPKDIIKSDLAAIRALYIEGGRTTDDIDEIMRTPTTLDGKNLTIIDEVSDTGSTIEISQLIFKAAIPELKSVSGHVFCSFGSYMTPEKIVNGEKQPGERQMSSAPIWYPKDHKYEGGRGVYDPDNAYWKAAYEANPTPENYAKLKADFAVSVPMNLEEEPEQRSKEMMREIKQLADDYHAGKILFRPSGTKWGSQGYYRKYAAIIKQGINIPSFQKICQEIDKRPPINYFSSEFPPK